MKKDLIILLSFFFLFCNCQKITDKLNKKKLEEQLKKAPINNQILQLQKSDKKSLQDYTTPYKIGKLVLKKGDTKSALKYADEAIKKKPNYSEAYLLKGDIYWQKENYKEARFSYIKAIEYDEKSARAYFGLGNCFFSEGDLSEAMSLFKQAIALKTDFAEAYLNLGFCYYRRKQYAKSISMFQKAVKYDSQFAGAYLNLGLLYQKTGDNTKAVEYFNQYIKLKPYSDKAELVKKIIEKLQK